jgi:hypothetical protein
MLGGVFAVKLVKVGVKRFVRTVIALTMRHTSMGVNADVLGVIWFSSCLTPLLRVVWSPSLLLLLLLLLD